MKKALPFFIMAAVFLVIGVIWLVIGRYALAVIQFVCGCAELAIALKMKKIDDKDKKE
ncbi:MAG: hypothetical protein IJ071_11410 [Ruminococcus sp.]|nr:hypothetical protein [Ruminococcus sp.]